jgi:two-component system, NarL family, sensor kinase
MNNFNLKLKIYFLTIVLEYSTPVVYVFSYFYIAAIILASYYLPYRSIMLIATLAIILTILNLFIPQLKLDNYPIVANRLIAISTLLITGWLSARLRLDRETISHQKQEINSQRKLAAMREDFVSTLTHDLKTPLLGSIEAIKLLRAGQFGNLGIAQQQVLETMLNSHKSSLELVKTLLDIYRYDEEGIKLDLVKIDLVTILEQTIVSLVSLTIARSVYLVSNYNNSDFRQKFIITGDRLQLIRVFTNLLINAIDHSPRGSKIKITLERDDRYHRVIIQDAGSGIHSQELPHIFDRFYQGNSHRLTQGSGLGLYLSRQIVEAHGGIIWAKNIEPSGAIFGCSLPINLSNRS